MAQKLGSCAFNEPQGLKMQIWKFRQIKFVVNLVTIAAKLTKLNIKNQKQRKENY